MGFLVCWTDRGSETEGKEKEERGEGSGVVSERNDSES